MKPHTLTPYPMTPPDDPPEPVLDDALPCPECGYEPIGQTRADGQKRVRCDQNHLVGSWEDTGNKAIEYWNSAVEERKGEQLKAQGQQQVAEKTAAELATHLLKTCDRTSDAFSNFNDEQMAFLLRSFEVAIAEIRRDAREGMVPVEDLRPLFEVLAKLDCKTGLDWEIGELFDALRTKHPNLFTK